MDVPRVSSAPRPVGSGQLIVASPFATHGELSRGLGALVLAGARFRHRYGPRVAIVDLDALRLEQPWFDAQDPEALPYGIEEALSRTERLGLAATRLRWQGDGALSAFRVDVSVVNPGSLVRTRLELQSWPPVLEAVPMVAAAQRWLDREPPPPGGWRHEVLLERGPGANDPPALELRVRRA